MGVKEICDSSGIQTRKWCIVIVCIYYTVALPILLDILVIPVTSSYWKYETGKAQVFLKFESPQWLCVQEPQLAPPFLHLVGLGIIGFSELSFLSPFILQVGYPCPMCRVLIPNLLFSKHSYLVSNTTSRNSQKKKHRNKQSLAHHIWDISGSTKTIRSISAQQRFWKKSHKNPP